MITPEESRAIYYVRPLSMMAIVLCHLCQSYGNRWAFIFNAGVQVFLVLSGYLYGKKDIVDWKAWGMGRIKRVYVPVFILLLVALPFYLFFARDSFNAVGYSINFSSLQGFPFTLGGVTLVPGLRHLWFITAIMLAYLSIPLLQYLKKYSDLLIPPLILGVLLCYSFVPMRYVFILSWIYLYAIGYLLANVRWRLVYEWGALVVFVLITFFVSWDHILSYFNPLGRLFHDVAGVFLVVWGIKLFSVSSVKCVPPFVKILDKYSFDIFLIHYLLLTGPFSMAQLTPNRAVNITLFILMTAALTYLFVCLQNLLKKKSFLYEDKPH